MNLETIFALTFRFGMIFVYLYLMVYFYKGYQNSKKSGFTNSFFLGFTIIFAALIFFHILYGTYELYSKVAIVPVDLKSNFSWYVPNSNEFVERISNQIRPLYLVFYFIMNIVMASLIYPLEKILGWKKNPCTKLVIIFGSTLWLLFIPQLSYTVFAIVPITLGFLGMAIGFILNIGVNIKLFKDSTGAIRKRSLYAILAFLFLAFGLYASMEVGFVQIFVPESSYRWDIIVGSIIQIVAVVFYRIGFAYDDEKPKIGSYLLGKITNKQLWIHVAIFLGLGVFYIVLARLSYPEINNYSIWTDTISFLGSSDADNNPNGWIFLSLALITFALMFFPLNFYRFRKMKKISLIGAAMSLLFYTIATLGLILVAIFPDNGGEAFFGDLSAGRVHNLVSLFAFGGFGAGILWDFLLLVKDQIPLIFGKRQYKPSYWIPMVVLFFTVVGFTAYYLLKWDIICEQNCWPGEGLYSFPFWEWMVFYTLFSVMFWEFFVLQNPQEKVISS